MPSFEPEHGPVLLHGDYEYLAEGYYACEEAEEAHQKPLPTCADVLDAYVVPLALERARLAGLSVPEWYLTNEDFRTPAVLYGVNPFARNHLVVHDAAEKKEAVGKISRQGKFVACCQELPPQAELVTFEMVLGRCADAQYAVWAEDVYRTFRLPLARVRLIVSPEGTWLSAIERLPRAEMSEASRRLLEEKIRRGECHG